MGACETDRNSYNSHKCAGTIMEKFEAHQNSGGMTLSFRPRPPILFWREFSPGRVYLTRQAPNRGVTWGQARATEIREGRRARTTADSREEGARRLAVADGFETLP